MTMNRKTVIANALYYLYRMEEAADEQKFDNQELEYFTRSGEMYNFVENIAHESEGVKDEFKYNEYKDHYNAAYGKIWAKLWAGLPKKTATAKEDRAKFADGTYNQIEFEIGKSNEYSGKMKEWYLDWAYSAYNLNASFGYLLESDPRYEQVLADLKSAIAKTSEELCIHRSTLYYRLKRIADITGTDLNSGLDRFTLHLELKLFRLTSVLLGDDEPATA